MWSFMNRKELMFTCYSTVLVEGKYIKCYNYFICIQWLYFNPYWHFNRQCQYFITSNISGAKTWSFDKKKCCYLMQELHHLKCLHPSTGKPVYEFPSWIWKNKLYIYKENNLLKKYSYCIQRETLNAWLETKTFGNISKLNILMCSGVLPALIWPSNLGVHSSNVDLRHKQSWMG